MIAPNALMALRESHPRAHNGALQTDYSLSTNLSYAAFDAARAFLCAMAAIGQKPDIRLREEMGVDIG